jgi:hypothetical protein
MYSENALKMSGHPEWSATALKDLLFRHVPNQKYAHPHLDFGK